METEPSTSKAIKSNPTTSGTLLILRYSVFINFYGVTNLLFQISNFQWSNSLGFIF